MGWFDSVGDVVSGISGSDVSTALDIGSSALSIGAGVSGLLDDSASEARKAQNEALRQQSEFSARQASIGDEGGLSLMLAFDNYLKNIGERGFYSPDQIDELVNQFEKNKQNEVGREKKAVRNLEERLLNRGESFQEGTTPNYSQIADIDPGGYYDEMDRLTADVSAREGNYDGLVNELSQGYLDRFSDNTERAVDQLYANQEVDAIRKGMDRSTYDIESKKASSAQAKKLYDQDVMKAIDEALSFVQSRQGLDANNQGMRVQQLSGEMNKANTGMNARAQAQGDRYKTAGLQMQAGSNQLMDKLRALDAGTNLMSNAQGLRSNMFNTPNTKMEALDKAYSTFGKQSDARRSGLNEMTYAVGKPYEFQSTGVQNAGRLNSGAITGWNNAYNTASQSRYNAGKNLGFGVDQLGEVSWNNIFGDDD